MKRLAMLLLLSMCLCGCRVSVSTGPEKIAVQRGTDEQRAEVLRATQSIVREMDKGKFDAVWDGSSQLLKDATFKVVFTKSLAATRGNLGKAVRGDTRIGFSRKIDPNAPDGDYAVVEVDSNFGGTIVTEKVILARESRDWKLVGYFMNSTKKFGGG